MSEKSHHELFVFVQYESPSHELWKKGFDRAPDLLQLLEGDVLELVWARPEASGFYVVAEDRTPSETAGVAVHVGWLDGLEDGGSVVIFGHLSPPLEIALELLGESDCARPGCRRGDKVVEFSKVKPRHSNCEEQELRLSC